MASMAQPVQAERSDARTIVSGGIKLGVVTAVSVVIYALVSRAMSGPAATIVQTLMLLIGGAIFAYGPSWIVRPRSVDGIAWAAMAGLMGALAFTVIDTAVLRPVHIYSWKWDAIGGGSGMWYIPVWWMGSSFVAWFGAWVTATAARNNPNPGLSATALPTIGTGIVIFALLAATGIAPFHQEIAALSFTIGLIVHALITAFFNRK